MLVFQELGDALIGGIVDQDRAQQRLLGLEIVRRLSEQEIVRSGQARDVVGLALRFHAA